MPKIDWTTIGGDGNDPKAAEKIESTPMFKVPEKRKLVIDNEDQREMDALFHAPPIFEEKVLSLLGDILAELRKVNENRKG